MISAISWAERTCHCLFCATMRASIPAPCCHKRGDHGESRELTRLGGQVRRAGIHLLMAGGAQLGFEDLLAASGSAHGIPLAGATGKVSVQILRLAGGDPRPFDPRGVHGLPHSRSVAPHGRRHGVRRRDGTGASRQRRRGPALALVAVARGALERGKELLSPGARASGATGKSGKDRQRQSKNEKISYHMVYTSLHRRGGF